MAVRVRRLREFKTRRDFLVEYKNDELIRRYRMDMGGIVFVTDLVRHLLTSPPKRNFSIDAEMKIAITLRFLATGKMQLCSGDDFGVSQLTVSRVVVETLDVLSDPHIVQRFVSMPISQQETQRHKRQFHALAGFPGVIDGTHVRILAPSQDEAEFVNRKNYHPINTEL
ncbi:hypothetical protein SNE40_013735 [Patella caerulea]|uniref:Nuclease HARBI1 n=1 Tax=Patella caerulea TaxID=87958 RepID=A0AAN8PHN3_PATCE